MSLNSRLIVSILQNLIKGELVNTPLGKGLLVNPRDAFLFSSITGAAYFENQIFPFTPKGLLKVFYNAHDYNLVTGIFDNATLKNTPRYIVEDRTYILDDPKIIVPLEIQNESNLRVQLKNSYGQNGFDNNLLILRVDTSKKGYGLEPLMEYIACMHFTKLGYITENQIPLTYKLGSPDFSGYSIRHIQTAIKNSGLLPGGFNILELAMLKSFPLRSISEKNLIPSDLIVGEAKTSTTSMIKQLNKYIGSGLFDTGIEIHPSKSEASVPTVGIMNLQNDEVVYIPPVVNKSHATSQQINYKKWLETYFNSYLISNYTNDELNQVALKTIGTKINSKEDLLKMFKDVTFNEHLGILKTFLKNGSI